MASQITIDEIDIKGLPKECLADVTSIIKQLLPEWFSTYQIKRLDKTILKYCNLINVSHIWVQDGRLEVELL